MTIYAAIDTAYDQDSYNNGTGPMNTVDNSSDETEMTFEAIPVNLPRGLIGFPDFSEFGLIEIPDPRLQQFKLLQAINDPDLSFLVLPIAIEGGPYDKADIATALSELGIAAENTAILSIVTVRNDEDGFSATANLLAPIFLDTNSNNGHQHVFSHNKYNVRQSLS